MWIGTSLVVVCSFALAGCSGAAGSPQATVTVTAGAPATGAAANTSSAARSSVVLACSILTKADAQAIVGAELQPGQEGQPAEPSCEYDTSPTGPKTAQVRFTIGDGAKKTYDIDRSLKHAFTRIPGIGDEAWEEPFAIFVRKGTTWYGITVVLLDDASVAAKPLRVAAATVLPQVH
ncbi:MAG: hypothetical protein JWQ92_2213 [Amnibacterium sp.]|nr:hypothetical protein [Amnibacterium sp.]